MRETDFTNEFRIGRSFEGLRFLVKRRSNRVSYNFGENIEHREYRHKKQ